MATADLKNAASAIPGVQPGAYLPLTEGSVFACPADKTWIGTVYVTNETLEGGSPAPATAFVSIVNSGGSAGVQRILANTLAVGQTVVYKVQLNAGDYISGKSGTASAVTLVPNGTFFSAAPGTGLFGIQDDANGTGGRTSGTGTVAGTNLIGTAADRYLSVALMIANQGAAAAYSSYTTFSVSCTDGPMTRLVSIDMNPAGAAVTGSIHIFGRANPTSGSTQTITANVAKSGVTVDLTMASMSLSGVGSVGAAVTSAPSGAAALSLPITSAIGHRTLFAGALDLIPRDFTQRLRAYNNTSSVNFNSTSVVPHNLLFADAPGAGTVTFAESVASYLAAVAVDLVPA